MANYQRSNVAFAGPVWFDNQLTFNSVNDPDVINDSGQHHYFNADGTVTAYVGSGLSTDINGVPTGGTVDVIKRFTFDGTTLTPIETIDSFGSINFTSIFSQVQAGTFFTTLFNGVDTVNGGTQDNTLFGFGGDDTIHGGTGSDTIDGGDGNDTIFDPAGVTTHILGGKGNDRIVMDVAFGSGTINGGKGVDTLSAQTGTSDLSTVQISNVENLEVGTLALTGFASQFQSFKSIRKDAIDLNALVAVSLVATGGPTKLNLAAALSDHGGRGISVNGSTDNETITTGAKNDNLLGGGGNDRLIGGRGDDALDGGSGNDTMIGGKGNDIYVVDSASDTIIEVKKHGGAADSVQSSVDFKLGKLLENLTLTGTAISATGNAKANIITGNDGNNTIEGLGGNDTLDGGNNGADGDAVVYVHATKGVTVSLAINGVAQNTLGAGVDNLTGFENLFGSNFNDHLTGDGADNVLAGGKGNDTLDGAGGHDRLFGGDGNDVLIGAASPGSSDELHGDAGIDTVSYANTNGVTANLTTGTATTGDTLFDIENLIGGIQADQLTGNSANNRIDGGDGSDRIFVTLGTDTLIGGADSDFIDFSTATNGVTFNLATLTAQNTGFGTVTASGFENILGSVFDDNLKGDANANIIQGGTGDDLIEGGAGADILHGDANGPDGDTVSYASSALGVTVNFNTGTYSGGDAAGDALDNFENIIGSAKADALTGDGGDNIIEGGAGADTLDGNFQGAVGDTVSYAHSALGVTVDLSLAGAQVSAGDASGDILSNFENILGSAHADTLTGNALDNIIEGGAGADSLDGGGNQSGGDTLSYAHSALGVIVDLSANAASGGDAQGDTISNFENILGSAHADTLTGDAGDNIIEGGAGADTLDGGSAGSDTVSYARSALGVSVDISTNTVSGGDAQGDTISDFANIIGSAQADTLIGDGADNVLTGGVGADTLTGGSGANTYIFNLGDDGDHITDFVSGLDKISLSFGDVTNFASGANPTAASGDQWFLYDTDDGKLYFDADGNGGGAAQLLLTLDGAPTLLATDLVNF